MLSLLVIISLLTICGNSCSPPMPIEGKYYISNTQLLPAIAYPDSILLTIGKTAGLQPIQPLPSTNTNNYGPWCKIMNIQTGSVSDIVTCSDYTNEIREYATPDPKTTIVSCYDNCDGRTATCMINRNGNPYTFNNIRYLASSTNCNSPGIAPKPIGNIFISFTIINNNGITTTYISFATNMIGIEWDDTMSPVGYIIYDVDREGDWSALTPGDYFADINTSPSVYSDVNIIQIALPCCICHSQRLITYSITSNRIDRNQVFSLKELGWGGGQIDAVKLRVLNRGLFYSDAITVYDLSQDGVANTVRPNLCDFIARCFVEPCRDTTASIHCPSYPNARCVNEYCGGCNARWFCGSSDITNYCNSGFMSTRMCPVVN